MKIQTFSYNNSVARVCDAKDLVVTTDDKTKVLFHFVLSEKGTVKILKGEKI